MKIRFPDLTEKPDGPKTSQSSKESELKVPIDVHDKLDGNRKEM